MNKEEEVKTTGGVFSADSRAIVVANICDVFNCTEDDIFDLTPVQKGLTNIVLSFFVNGTKYIYRHPGLGSDSLVDRGRETIMQLEAGFCGADTSLVAMSVRNGWRISRFVENVPFDYHDEYHRAKAILLLRKLHQSKVTARWEFDILEKIEQLKSLIPQSIYGHQFSDFHEIDERCRKLFSLSKTDGVAKCFCHGDCRDENFLINSESITLIDWEYSGYCDPGFDIGSYICGGEHSDEDIDDVLYLYFGRTPTFLERRHFLNYIALTGFFYMHWTMYKEYCGQEVGILKKYWHAYAARYSVIALQMYQKEKQ
jgi:thiamine kinase-like enzyme